MSKSEMVRQSAERANAQRIERLASQIEATRKAEVQSAEELAALLEPLAQAMAVLTAETRQTLSALCSTSEQQVAQLAKQMNEAAAAWQQATARAQQASERLDRIGSQMEWRHYSMAALVGAMAAGLVLASWLWLAPLPIVQNHLDPKVVAEHLRPALIQTLPPPAAPATTRRR